MYLDELLPLLRQEKATICRRCWDKDIKLDNYGGILMQGIDCIKNDNGIYEDSEAWSYELTEKDLFADDWEIYSLIDSNGKEHNKIILSE